jgi:hypothetical protein
MSALRLRRFAEVNPEWWLLLSLFIVAACIDFFGFANQMLLVLYFLPTLFSAYWFGRRHATLTAFASVFLAMIVLTVQHSARFDFKLAILPSISWMEFTVWAGILVVSAYALGTVFRELRETYATILILLNELTNDSESASRSEDVADYACALAEQFQLPENDRVELRRLAKLRLMQRFGVRPQILAKAIRFVDERYELPNTAAASTKVQVQGLETALRRAIDIERSGEIKGKKLPIEHQLILAAEDYDEMVSRGGRKVNPAIAVRMLSKESGKAYGPEVIEALGVVAAVS